MADEHEHEHERRDGAGRAPSTPRRGARRIALIAAAVLVLVPAVVLAVLLGGLATGVGRDAVADIAQSSAADAGVHIEGLELGGPFVTSIRARRVTVADRAGVWLTAQDVAIDWSPGALLSGRLTVDRLSAAAIRVDRAPLPEPGARKPAAAGPPKLELPSLPVAVDLSGLRIGRIQIAPEVAGTPVDVALAGRARLDDRGLSTALDVRSLAPDASHLGLEATLDRENAHLGIHLDLDDPGSGALAQALGLPGSPPVRARVEGDGPIDGWVGTAKLAAGPDLGADLRLKLSATAATPRSRRNRPAEGGTAWSADLGGTLRLAAFLQGPLGDKLDVDAAVSGEGRRVTVQRLRVDGPGVRLGVTGGTDGETVDARIGAEVDDSTALAPWLGDARLGGGRLDATVAGPIAGPSLAADFAFERVGSGAMSVGHVEGTLRGGRDGKAWTGGVEAKLDGVDLGDPALATLLGSSLTLSADARLPDGGQPAVPHFAVAGDTIAASGSAEPAPAAPAAKGGWTVDAAIDRFDIAALAGYVPMQGLAGRLSGKVAGTVGADGAVDAAIDARAVDARFGIDPVDRLLGAKAALSGKVTMAAGGALSVRDLAIAGAGGRLTGTLAFPAGFETMTVKARLQAPSLARLQPGIDGALDLTASLSGPTADPAVDARAEIQGLQRGTGKDAVEIGRLNATFTGQRLAQAPAGHLTLDAATVAGRIVGSAGWAAPGWKEIRLTDLSVRRDTDRIAGTLALPLDGRAPTGHVNASADLARWSAFLGTDISGKLTADATLGSPRRRGKAEAGTVTAHLHVVGLGVPGAAADSISATVNATGLPDRPAGRITIEAERLRGGGHFLPKLALAANVTPDTLTLTALDGRLGRETLRLIAPAHASWKGDATTVDLGTIALGDARIALTAKLDAKRASLRLRVRTLPLELLAPRSGVRGRIDVDADLSGPPADIGGPLHVTVHDVQGHALAGTSLAIDARGRVGGGRLTVAARLTGLPGQPASATADLPLSLSLSPPGAAVDDDGRLEARLRWQGRVGPLMAVLPFGDDNRLDGDADIDLTVTGTPAHPDVAGHVALAHGRYESLALGTVLSPIDMRITGSDGHWTIERFRAEDGGGGSVTASGQLALARDGMPDGRVELVLDRATLLRRNDATATLSGNIHALFDPGNARITGDITAEPVDVSLAEGLPADVQPVEVTDINRNGRPNIPRAPVAPKPPPLPIALAIKINVPRRLHVEGRGLTSEWNGGFDVTGTLAEPVIRGSLHPVRGQFNLAGKAFQLSNGSITIDPRQTGHTEPVLDLTATYTGRDITATVEITGTAGSPTLTLSSTPALPQDEVLSHVLFGKSTGQLSAAEAVQLAQGVAALSGMDSGPGILDRIRRGLGLDVLGFTSGEDGGPGRARAGTYLGDKVFVGVEQGITPGSTGVSVEVELTPSISLHSTTSADEGTTAGVRWKRDY